MHQFVKTFVAPLLSGTRWKSVCEIGASLGGGTEMLAKVPDVKLTVIDPCYDCDLAEKFSGNPRVTVRKGTSLAVLPSIRETFDCILIDGDHNWYTVFHELKAIFDGQLLRPGGIVFFHDVDWPWGRRDMYYVPEQIPDQYRKEWRLEGIAPGIRESSAALPTLSYLKKAASEGGTQNGVLTAVEDHMREHLGDYRLFLIHAGVGLGIMQYRGTFRDRLSFLLLLTKGLACNIAIRLMRIVRPGRAYTGADSVRLNKILEMR